MNDDNYINQDDSTNTQFEDSYDYDATVSNSGGILGNIFSTMKMVANDRAKNYSAIIKILGLDFILTIIALMITAFRYEFYKFTWRDVYSSFSSVFFYVFILSTVIHFMNHKRSFGAIFATMVIARIPRVVNTFIGVVEIIIEPKISFFSPISSMFSTVAMVLEYYGLKCLYGEEKDAPSLVKRYAIIVLIASAIRFVLARIEISLL